MNEKDLVALLRKIKQFTHPSRELEVWSCLRCERRHKGMRDRSHLVA